MKSNVMPLNPQFLYIIHMTQYTTDYTYILELHNQRWVECQLWSMVNKTKQGLQLVTFIAYIRRESYIITA